MERLTHQVFSEVLCPAVPLNLVAYFLLYVSLFITTSPLDQCRYTKWLFKIIALPLLIIFQIMPVLMKVVITLMGSIIILGIIVAITKIILSYYWQVENHNVFIFIGLTGSTIIMITKLGEKIVIRLGIILHSYKEHGIIYNKEVTQYLIYSLYFIILSTSYFYKFMGNSYNDVFIASFATYIAFERLITNADKLKSLGIINTYTETLNKVKTLCLDKKL